MRRPGSRGARLLPLMMGAAVVLTVGCATDSSTPVPLEDRVEEYYRALEGRELAAAYELEHSQVRRSVSREEYASSDDSALPVIESFTVVGVSIDGDRALAKLEIRFVMDGELRTSRFNDAWVQEDGQWYHAPN